MSQNSSASPVAPATPPLIQKRPRNWIRLATLPFWVIAGFVVSQLVITGVLLGLSRLGISFTSLNPAIFSAITAVIVYTLTLIIVIGMPWWLKKKRTSLSEVGLNRLPSWTDIALAPAGFIVYFIVSAVIIYAVTQLVPAFNANEAQEVGFDNLTQRFEYLLAFVTLVLVAPFAEEVLFRGFLYGKLRKAVPLWLAILVTSLVFGFIHGRWNVAIDVFTLSIIMCGLRELTGSIWAGILIHTIKNGIAFYLLFINPSILNTMG